MKSRKQKDVWLYRMIITALGLTLVALGSAAIGGLAGFLVPSHLNR